MANDVVFQADEMATPPAGTVAAAEEIAGKKYQWIKLAAGTLGSTTPVGITTAPLSTSAAFPTPVVTNPAASLSSQTLLTANAFRKSFIIHNDSTGILYVKYGVLATASDFTAPIPQNGLYSDDGYSGNVDAIGTTAVGAYHVTEIRTG